MRRDVDNYKKLFSAALRQFGPWRMALVAAGIEIPKYAYGSRLGIRRAITAFEECPVPQLPNCFSAARTSGR